MPLAVRIPLFLPRLARVSGSTCTGSGSSTSDSVATYRSNNACLILYLSSLPQLNIQNTHNYQPEVQILHLPYCSFPCEYHRLQQPIKKGAWEWGFKQELAFGDNSLGQT
jgi:hypothetical protein